MTTDTKVETMTKLQGARRLPGYVLVFMFPLAFWYLTLAYAFGVFHRLWMMPISLIASLSLASWALSRLLASMSEERRFISLVAYVALELTLMVGMIFLFEWNEPLRWNKPG